MLISGPKNTSGLGNELGLVNNYIVKAVGDDHISSSQMQDDGVTVTIPYTASIGNIVGLGGPTAFSTSVDSRLDVVEATASLYIPLSTSVNSRLDVVEATASLHIAFSTSVDSRLDVVEATASLYVPLSTSVNSRLDVVEATASLYVPFSTSVDSRLVSSATTGSNIFKGNQTISGSITISGSSTIVGNQTISGSSTFTGSTLGNIVSMSIVSNTASMDFNAGNYFTIKLNASATPTRLNPTNVRAGQTISLVVTQAATLSGSLSFPTSVKFPTGSYYTASRVVNAIDILTFITVDTASIHAVSVKSMGL
jgi:DNA-dependent RNA polymerase auxiliary subunit epsilon